MNTQVANGETNQNASSLFKLKPAAYALFSDSNCCINEIGMKVRILKKKKVTHAGVYSTFQNESLETLNTAAIVVHWFIP